MGGVMKHARMNHIVHCIIIDKNEDIRPVNTSAHIALGACCY